MEKTHFNYTNVCWFCGTIYRSNRSTSKYCNRKHNSLYNAYGSRIKLLPNANGLVVNYNSILKAIYSELEIFSSDSWGVFYSSRCIKEDFNYKGPLPTGSELLLVGKYLIKALIAQAVDGSNIYCVKPFTELTFNEKSTARIIPSLFDANGDVDADSFLPLN